MSIRENFYAVRVFLTNGAQIVCNHFSNAYNRVVKRSASTTICLVVFFVMLLIGSFIYRNDFSVITGEAIFNTKSPMKSPPKEIVIPPKCLDDPAANYSSTVVPRNLSATACPEYFRWIHEDLKPWKSTGITRDMVDRAKHGTHFRLAIIKGKLYVKKYKNAWQTRDVFTIWGVLQLLRLYPGMVPDLELEFSCEDEPVIKKRHYQLWFAKSPPTVFHYCRNDETLDIVFPDWTYWGWVETNIKPWKTMLKNIKEGNKKINWTDRVPYAYWKGNPGVSKSRGDLMKCNVSDKYDWNARLYVQDWDREIREGFKHSKLEDQCTDRYKIYIEGRAWSVSEKYILACDSMTLLVRPRYYDFFNRGLVPMQHYWPIRTENKCRDIKFAVEWGNNDTSKAQSIGEAGSKFMQEDLKMEYVYDYMFHLLTEYSKLLKFKPSIPEGAEEVRSETMACNENGLVKEFMVESMVKSPSDTLPCALPLYDLHALEAFLERKENITRQVEVWESEYWENHNRGEFGRPSTFTFAFCFLLLFFVFC